MRFGLTSATLSKSFHRVARRTRTWALVGAVMMLATAAAAGETQYKYDPQGQLVLATDSDGRQAGYGYDDAGNRVSMVSGARQLPTYPDRLLAGQSLLPGKSLQSSNGLYTLVFQPDGNIVQYGQGGVVRWQSFTAGKIGARLTMQNDGNLVVYGPVSQVYWNAATFGNPGAGLVLQDDGNMVIYSSAGAPLWHIYQ